MTGRSRDRVPAKATDDNNVRLIFTIVHSVRDWLVVAIS